MNEFYNINTINTIKKNKKTLNQESIYVMSHGVCTMACLRIRVNSFNRLSA